MKKVLFYFLFATLASTAISQPFYEPHYVTNFPNGASAIWWMDDTLGEHAGWEFNKDWYFQTFTDSVTMNHLAGAGLETAPTGVVGADADGNLWKYEPMTFTAGSGIDITGTYPDFTISLEAEEMPMQQQQFNAEVAADYVIEKVEYYDLEGNLITPAATNEYLVKVYFLNGQTVTQKFSEKK